MEGEEPGPFVIDTVLYGTDSFYPQQITEVGTPAVWRDVRVTVLSLYPVSFNPVTGILRVYDDLTVQLNYSGTDGVNPLVNPPPVVSPSFDRMYRRVLINYDYLSLDVSDVPLGYLIITPCGYVTGPAVLEPFVEWKRAKGIPVFVERFGECIEDGPDDPMPIEIDTTWIKETITQYYYDYGIEYVLLVGSTEDTPIYYYYPPFGFPSDFWYTLIAGDDTIADVALGRFSVYSSTDVATNVNKIFAYERWPASDWNVEKALFVAGNLSSYQDCKEFIASDIMAESGFDILTAYGAQEEVTNQTVVDAFESTDGVGIVNYRGHGGHVPDAWAVWNLLNQDFSTVDAHALTNFGHFPVVFNISCMNGSIHKPWEVLAEAFFNNPNGGGSGSLGGTTGTWRKRNHTFDRGLFRATFDGYCDIYELGIIINDAKNYMMTNWDFDTLSAENAQAYLWLGDPQMELWTKQPETMDADYPGRILAGQPTEVTVSVTWDENPLSGALVCLYKPWDVFERGVTGTNGEETFTVNPTTEGDLNVTVSKHNFQPFEGTIEIRGLGVPPETEAVPLTFSLSQNYPNPFNSNTAIGYQLPGVRPHRTTLKVYNIAGRRVRTLVDGQKEPGSHRVCWNCKDDGGQPVASGVYFCRLKAGGFTQVKRMLLLR